MNSSISQSTLYRLPFKWNDNSNGWIEITTHCNSTCPGCYRGCDRSDQIPQHRQLQEIQDEILKIQKMRKCHSISISGGEPFLHPDLGKIIRFIRMNRMAPIVFTNGKLLDATVLRDLKQQGLAGAMVRIDSLKENRTQTEDDLMPQREYFSHLLHNTGLFCGLTTCLDKRNFSEVPSLIRWAQSRNDKVDMMLLILRRKIIFNTSDPIFDENMIHMKELLSYLTGSIPELKFNSFLGSTLNDKEYKWLLTTWLSKNNKILCYLDNKFMNAVQTLHHLFRGCYCSITYKKYQYLPMPIFLGIFLFNRSLRSAFQVLLSIIRHEPSKLLSRLKVSMLLIVNPPYFVNGERDLCDGCPDAILFNGKLEPSCLLEEIRRFGGTYSLNREVKS